MKSKELTIGESMKLEIDLEKEGNRPFVVVYCGGKAKFCRLPEHGEYKIITHQGKVKRMRNEEGEEF
ncbi:XtrA/YqaO family protein [Bacillus tianshenii]|nr:XtrA/YqaO family protein [Bacillus tianshenii]